MSGRSALLLALVVGCRRSEPIAKEPDAAPAGVAIDRSCATIDDCVSTCALGPLNKNWYQRYDVKSCWDGCDGAMTCFEGTCAPKEAIVNGKLDRSHACLKSHAVIAERPKLPPLRAYVVVDVRRMESIVHLGGLQTPFQEAGYLLYEGRRDPTASEKRWSIYSEKPVDLTKLPDLTFAGIDGGVVRLRDFARVEAP
jgi:hypothetical protein